MERFKFTNPFKPELTYIISNDKCPVCHTELATKIKATEEGTTVRKYCSRACRKQRHHAKRKAARVQVTPVDNR